MHSSFESKEKGKIVQGVHVFRCRELLKTKSVDLQNSECPVYMLLRVSICSKISGSLLKVHSEHPYRVTGQGESSFDQCLQGQPLDRSILIVPQTVVVCGEQVPRQRVVCQLQQQVIVYATKNESQTIVVTTLISISSIKLFI